MVTLTVTKKLGGQLCDGWTSPGGGASRAAKVSSQPALCHTVPSSVWPSAYHQAQAEKLDIKQGGQ